MLAAMTRDAFLSAAEVAAASLREPAVFARWSEPSALPGFSVGGLARHLANQVTHVGPALLAAPGTASVTVLEHYRRSAWFNEDIDGADNVRIRTQGDAAAGTQEVLAGEVDDALALLRPILAEQSADRIVAVDVWGLTLDDFLLTRVMELVVHLDDLAVSVGMPTPPLPPEATDAAIRLLADIAAWRHGPLAVVRALARQERAPATIAAF
jgi:hypothetical protein